MPAQLEHSSQKSPMQNHAENNQPSFDVELPQLDEALPISISPSDIPAHEASFTQNFTCCGLVLEDLHDLLQHFEEYHLRLEGVPNSSLEDGFSSASEYEFTSTPPASSGYTLRSYSTGPMQNGATKSRNAYTKNQNTLKVDALSDSDHPITYTQRVDNDNPKSQSNIYEISTEIKRSALQNTASTSSTILLSCPDYITSSEKKSIHRSFKKQKLTPSIDKPYKCLVSGCNKTYKNPNGLKYHSQHGHCTNSSEKMETSTIKKYRCVYLDCEKSYKNLNGLKYHIKHSHSITVSSKSLTQ